MKNVLSVDPLQKYLKPVFVGLLIVVVLLINIVGHKAVDHYSLKLDLTENGLYEFSEITIKTAASISKPVKITVFNRKEDFVIMLREVLKRFSALSQHISLRFVDPYENPVLIDYYAGKGVQIHQNDILLEGSVRTKAYSIKDLYTFNAGKTEITGLNAEQQLISALFYVNDPVVPVAAFVDGHNERPSKALIALFKDNNFEVVRGNLTSILQKKPDIVIIAAPTRDFLKEDVQLLDIYMNNGGHALLFAEPTVDRLPRLEGFTKNWGIVLGQELVFESQAFTGNNPINIVPMYGPHEINRYFMDTRVFLTMPSSRSLYAEPRPGSAYDVRTVLNSTPYSYGKKGYQFAQLKKEYSDIDGPFSLVMSSEKEIISDPGVSRLVVVGSKSFFGDDLLGFASYGNAEFIIQTINWLNEKELSLYIPPKKIKSDPLNILSSQALIIGVIITGLIPLLFLVSGIIVFIRRKKLS
jgi:ABC-2 type transport system permease protein